MRILEAIFGAASAVAVAFREDFVGQPRPAPVARRRAQGVAPVSADPTAGRLHLAQAQSGSSTGARDQASGPAVLKKKRSGQGRSRRGGASGGALSGGRESPSGRQ
jgi:hypothetical protein